MSTNDENDNEGVPDFSEEQNFIDPISTWSPKSLSLE